MGDDTPPGYESFFDWFDRECAKVFGERCPSRPTVNEIEKRAAALGSVDSAAGSFSLDMIVRVLDSGEPDGVPFVRSSISSKGIPPWEYRERLAPSENGVEPIEVREFREHLPPKDDPFFKMKAKAELHEERGRRIEPLFGEIKTQVLNQLVTGTVTAVVNTSKGLKPVDPGWWWGFDAQEFVLKRSNPQGRIFVKLGQGQVAVKTDQTKRGAKPKDSWPKVQADVIARLLQLGELPIQARVEEMITECLEADGGECAPSTAERYAKACIEAVRESRRQGRK